MIAAALCELEEDGILKQLEEAFPDSDVPHLARQALQRTLRDTTTVADDGSVFVVTGDIPAMWLRDSATQFWPYLLWASNSPHGAIADVICGVLRQQFRLIAHDPYANAFNAAANEFAHDSRDLNPDARLWERKYEVDSLCFPVQLAHRFWRITGRDDFVDDSFRAAARAIIDTLDMERNHEARSSYRFVRPGANRLDTLPREGLGSRTRPNGMTWSGFRPSDDACEYGFNVPANLLAVSALRQLSDLLDGMDKEHALRAANLAQEIHVAVLEHGIMSQCGELDVLCYETDGLGNHLFMDDANMPSLLSLPLLTSMGLQDPLYLRTRNLVLSEANPYFYAGKAASGVGSPHTWPGYVWPISMAVEALTSGSSAHQREVCELLACTTAGTGMMHESFDADDPSRFTRPWFSWADSMFCLLALEAAGISLAEVLRAGASL